jgi:beta-glucosidase
MALSRSTVGRLSEPTAFLWSAGIEDTFIAEPWPGTGRVLDEYELTGHYRHWREDMGLLAQLGVRVVRYGIPWYRINPAKGKWSWDWADRALEGLLVLGIEPIVDLVHYGVPAWIEGAFLAPDFPERMAEYAARVAERFRNRIHAYTPLNEPRVTAWYCGKLGWWPPGRRSWRGFVAVMLAACRGIVQTIEALHSVNAEILPVHVDATDIYETPDAALREEMERRQEIVFLALDLISGRVNEKHALHGWLLRQGANPSDLDWFVVRTVELGLIGINLYPMYSHKICTASARGLKIRMPYSSGELVERLGEMYWERYRCPLLITETASLGSVARRLAWLTSSVAAVQRLRARGVPMVGYTWWPVLGIVTWAYRQGRQPLAFYVKRMGLWDLDRKADLRRIRTPLVDAFRDVVSRESDAVGRLEPRSAPKSPGKLKPAMAAG